VDRDHATVRRFGNESIELGKAECLLVEVRIQIQQHLLQAIGAHHVAIRYHLLHADLDQLPRIDRARRLFFTRTRESGQRRVGVILVAVLNEQVRRRFTNAHANDVLAVLLQLEHQAAEVGVARKQDEGPDLGPREDEFERINGEADVGRILLRAAVSGRKDEIDGSFRERHHVLRVAAPVRIRSLYGHLALDDVAVEEVLELLRDIAADSHRDVVEVDEKCGMRRLVCGLGRSALMGRA